MEYKVLKLQSWKHRIARPHPTTPHSRHPSGGPGNLKTDAKFHQANQEYSRFTDSKKRRHPPHSFHETLPGKLSPRNGCRAGHFHVRVPFSRRGTISCTRHNCRRSVELPPHLFYPAAGAISLVNPSIG